MFAVDSLPAIFAITSDTFIVYTSNIMAILAQIFVADFWLGGNKFPPVVSLGVTFALIAVDIVYSLWKTPGEPEPDWPVETGSDNPARIPDRQA